MSSLKARLILALTGYGLLVGAGIAFVLHEYFPGLSWNWFLGIFIFFLALESVIINLVVNNSQNEGKKLVNVYMFTKVLKIILSLVFVLIYFIVERTNNIKSFVIVFIAFYLLFLIAETYLLTKVEKRIKSEKKNEE